MALWGFTVLDNSEEHGTATLQNHINLDFCSDVPVSLEILNHTMLIENSFLNSNIISVSLDLFTLLDLDERKSSRGRVFGRILLALHQCQFRDRLSSKGSSSVWITLTPLAAEGRRCWRVYDQHILHL